MLPNPVVELWRDPVTTLTALAYALTLTATIIVLVGVCWRNTLTLKVRWEKRGPRTWEYIPPLDFLLRAAAIPLVLAVVALELAGIIWLLTGP